MWSWGCGDPGPGGTKIPGNKGIEMEGNTAFPGSYRRALAVIGTTPGAGEGELPPGLREFGDLKKRLQDPNAHRQGLEILMLRLILF